jgi:putative regulator of septum formation
MYGAAVAHPNDPAPAPLPPAPAFAMPPPPPLPQWNGKTNGFSIAALTLALFGCTGVISIVLGFKGLSQSRRNGDKRGKVYALAALTICGLWLLAFLVFVAVAIVRDVADGPDRDETGAIRGERSIAVTKLQTGDCVKDLDSQTGNYIDVLPCTSPHSSEVFATYDLPAGTPTDEAAQTKAAESGCEQRYEAYAGTKEPEDPEIFLFTVRMNELTSASKDRGVLCIAHQRHGTTTGTLKK